MIRKVALIGGSPSSEKTYKAWKKMRRTAKQKGFFISKRWEKFENFLEDMGKAPEGLNLVRREYSKGFFPENCYWGTNSQLARSKPTTFRVYYDGQTKALRDWCDELELDFAKTRARLKYGWTVDKAFEL